MKFKDCTEAIIWLRDNFSIDISACFIKIMKAANICEQAEIKRIYDISMLLLMINEKIIFSSSEY